MSLTNLPIKMTSAEWAERDRQFGNGFHWCSRSPHRRVEDQKQTRFWPGPAKVTPQVREKPMNDCE